MVALRHIRAFRQDDTILFLMVYTVTREIPDSDTSQIICEVSTTATAKTLSTHTLCFTCKYYSKVCCPNHHLLQLLSFWQLLLHYISQRVPRTLAYRTYTRLYNTMCLAWLIAKAWNKGCKLAPGYPLIAPGYDQKLNSQAQKFTMKMRQLLEAGVILLQTHPVWMHVCIQHQNC